MRLNIKTALCLGSLLLVNITGVSFAISVSPHQQEVMVYKSSTCGCCGKWVTYLQNNGFKVTAENVPDINAIKPEYGIKPYYASCHTAIIGDYVVEGHVPVQAIQKLLDEQPKVKGITVPGMPIGSPGMEGPNSVSYDVYTFNHDGTLQKFMTIDK